MIIQKKLKGLASTDHNKWSFMCAITLFLYSKSLLGQDLKQVNLWRSYFIEKTSSVWEIYNSLVSEQFELD